MDYKKLYFKIIKNRLDNPVIYGYLEKHHILPKSLGGDDDPKNIVSLTPREHFICHTLLAKMYKINTYEWYKTNHALLMMKCSSAKQNRYFNSRIYEFFRVNFSKVMKKNALNRNNGKMWISNIKLQLNRKIKNTEIPPSGWERGRNLWKADEVKRRQALKQKENYRKKHPKRTKEELSKILSDSAKKRAKEHPLTVGKGKIWINDGVSIDKRILASDSIPMGWKKGRLYKKLL